MDKKIDLRILKTQSKLTTALAEMMQEVNFDQITVFQLCERAHIRRATFYKHFSDKYDLVTTVVRNNITKMSKRICEVCEPSDPVQYFSLFIREVITYFKDRPEVLSNLLCSNAFNSIFDIVTKCTGEALENDLKIASNQGLLAGADISTLASFTNGGLAVMVLFWLRNRDTTEEAFMSKINTILTRLFVR